jgi:hypothetical protein
MVTDGCVFVQKNNSHGVRLAIAQPDAYILESFRDALKTYKPVRYYSRKSPQQPVAELHICSKVMFGDLAKYGVVPNKSDKTFYPALIDEPRIHSAFIRGLLDGDGSACRRSETSASWSLYGTQKLLQGVAKTLEKYAGVSVKQPLFRKEKRFLHVLIYSSRADIRKLYSFLYGTATEGLYLCRKREKLEII